MKKKKLLHVGSGPNNKKHTTDYFNTDQWEEIRLDIDRKVKPDIVGTITDMQDVKTRSVDAIFSSHNIEHIYAHEVPKALKEFKRVLKPNGHVLIICPDLQGVCQLVAENKLTEMMYMSPLGPVCPIDTLYGFRKALSEGNYYMAHKCGFTASALHASLTEIGFLTSVVMRRPQPHYDLIAIATKEEKSEQDIMSIFSLHFTDIQYVKK